MENTVSLSHLIDRSVKWYRPEIVLGVWAVLLLIVAGGELLPGSSAPVMLLSQFALGDKMIHFIAYAVVASVPVLGLPLRLAVACVVTTELMGGVLEFAQRFVSGRSCDLNDIVANTGGVLIGILLATVLRVWLLGGREHRRHG